MSDYRDKINREVYPQKWRYQEGDYTVTRTTQWTAPGCHDGCGVLLHTNDEGKVVGIEGDPDNPFNMGTLCMRCLNMVEQVNHPDRVKWPLKRVGERGENKWERISWDEALDILEERVRYFQKNYGNESICTLKGTGRNTTWQTSFIANAALQTPNFSWGFLSGDACYMPRAALMVVLNGSFLVADMSQMLPERYDAREWVRPELILIWGNNPIISNADGFLGHWIIECMKRGSRLAVIDPRLTWLAAQADHWLRIRPGTDAALALAMLNVIIKEDLYDHNFVEKWTIGWDEFKERCMEYPVERVSQITWVPEEQIIALARDYATAKPAAIQWGLGLDTSINAIPASHALTGLWSITGNLDIPGGQIFAGHAFDVNLTTSIGIEWLSDELIAKRLGNREFKLRSYGIAASASPDMVLKALESGKPYPIKMTFSLATNPLSNMASEAPRVYAAMKKAEFNVYCDPFMTATAVATADLFLPTAMGCERDSTRVWWWPLRAIKKVTQYHECRSDEELVLMLTKRLNPEAAPWDTVPEMMSWFINNQGEADMTFDELVERTYAWPERYQYKKYEKGLLRPDGEPGFNTPSGYVELKSLLLEDCGLDPLPYYEEVHESPYGSPELFKEYPFVLTSGARSWEWFHSEHRQMPTMREFHPDPLVEIHPEVCKQLGLIEGDWVWIENMRGRCKQRVKCNITLDPRVVQAEHGWWFPEKEGAEPRLFDTFDSNINNLTAQCQAGPSSYGAPYKCTICKLYKVEPGVNDLVSPTEQVCKLGGFGYVKQ